MVLGVLRYSSLLDVGLASAPGGRSGGTWLNDAHCFVRAESTASCSHPPPPTSNTKSPHLANVNPQKKVGFAIDRVSAINPSCKCVAPIDTHRPSALSSGA